MLKTIIHTISSIDLSSGGPAQSVTLLIRGLLEYSEIDNLSLHTHKSKAPILKSFNNKKGEVIFYNANLIGFSSALKKNLNKCNVILFHGHGLWELPVHFMAVNARKRNLPYIISPRGMLDTWSIKNKSLKKRLALSIYQRKDLEQAFCLHATSDAEARNMRALGFKNPIAIIPNGVVIPQIKTKPKKKTVLFLARLVKNKGIEELINVWKQLNKTVKDGWLLKIVGDGDFNYVDQLKQRAQDDKSIIFLGALYDNAKQKIFDEASLFVLPTYTENFGVSIAEALAHSIPVITTKGAPWEDLETYNCGWWIENNEMALQNALENALKLNLEELKIKGDNGRQLISQKYSIESVAIKMMSLYQWLLKKGSRPDFVILK